MSEIKVYKFINQASENLREHLTLCTEWINASCKIMIFGGKQPLEGELTNASIEKFATDLSKSKELYVKETKESFSLKDPDVEFHVKDNNFKWKKGFWKLGYIELRPVDNIDVISAFLQKILTDYEIFQNDIDNIQSKNVSMITYQRNLEQKLEELTKMKQCMETELYKKFICVLNAKKRKVSELECILKVKDSQNHCYDSQTDDSQDMLNNFKKRKPIYNRIIRKMSKQSSEDDSVDKDDNFSPEVETIKRNSDMSNQLQESKLESVMVEENTKINSNQDNSEINLNQNNSEVDSNQDDSELEEDICLKLTDESTESIEKELSTATNIDVKNYTILEEESDEDLFSS